MTHTYAHYGSYPASLEVRNYCDNASWSQTIVLNQIGYLPLLLKTP